MMNRFLLPIVILTQNPTAFGFSLVLIPFLLVLAVYALFKLFLYTVLPGLLVLVALKLIDAHVKAKRRRALGPGLVRLAPPPELPSASQPLLLQEPRRW